MGKYFENLDGFEDNSRPPAAGRPASSLHDLLLDILAISEGNLTDPILTQEELIQEKLDPEGNGTFRAGRYMLFLYDASNRLKYKAFGESENYQLSYLSFAKMTHLFLQVATRRMDWIHGKTSMEKNPKLKRQRNEVRKPNLRNQK